MFSMHILQVAYDRGLLATRALLLERCGYLVTSVFGNDSAMGIGGDVLSTVDVVVIGFSTKPTSRSNSLVQTKLSRHPGCGIAGQRLREIP